MLGVYISSFAQTDMLFKALSLECTPSFAHLKDISVKIGLSSPNVFYCMLAVVFDWFYIDQMTFVAKSRRGIFIP